MKNLLFIFFIVSGHFLSAKNIEDIDAMIHSGFNESEYRKTIREERDLYAKTKDKHHLYTAVYVEAFLESNLGNGNGRIRKLLWVIENCPQEYYKLYIFANYHLSAYLVYLNSAKNASEFINLALETAKKYRYEQMYHLLYSSKGAIEYQLGHYNTSIPNYKMALETAPKNSFVFRASMNNNVSLCYNKLQQYITSNLFIEKAIREMKHIPSKNEGEIYFLTLIRGNLGSNYFRMGKLTEAKKLLNEEIDYYLKHPEHSPEALHPIQDLLAIYAQQNDKEETNRLVGLIPFFEEKTPSLLTKNEYIKLLYEYHLKRNDAAAIKSYGEKLVHNNQILSDSIVKNSEKLNNTVFSQKINHLKNQFDSKDKLLETTIRAKRNTTIFLIIIFSVISFILVLLYFVRIKNERKNKLIQEQEQLIETKKRIILENELKLKQEKITNLAINLNIKKETENAFLQKLKEIRRKKNVDPETIIKELQFSISNLISIDQRNVSNSEEVEHENTKFISGIKELHPDLSKQEISLCSYFRMNLNSKEIASLTGMTSGTIRVYKNKIKVKIGLNQEESLNNYLQNI